MCELARKQVAGPIRPVIVGAVPATAGASPDLPDQILCHVISPVRLWVRTSHPPEENILREMDDGFGQWGLGTGIWWASEIPICKP